MIERDFKSILQQPYSLEKWQNIFRDIFRRPEFLLPGSYLPLFENIDFVARAFQFGSIILSDNRRVALIDVELTDNKAIARNRVQLREMAAKVIDGHYQGLLVLFHAPKQNDYRLSFISKISAFGEEGELVTTQTAPKRFTYVLGPKESCTTAARRLTDVANSDATIKSLTEAFNVEKLNKEFFKGYKEQYERFWSYINDQPEYRKLLIDNSQSEQSKVEKPIRDFAKKLLGRIVFLYFLQKKGWLGIHPDQDKWVGGDANFMRRFFETSPDKTLFYETRLVELFFRTLNRQRKGDIFALTGTKIPYLNGGLFENDIPHTNRFNFPDLYFSSLFDFFDQYNFTIDENSPDDAEVGIDPEMLGHIFENLLEENKDKGTFYTPKAIVQYMCQESLIQYLTSNFTGDEHHESLDNFIRRGERGEPKGFISKNARKIEDLLDHVKICDPAIGSGAFPMGMLQEIFKAKMALDWTLDPAETKRHIIQNSIYGVDLEKGAVDIARLRFWLALVVDEDTPSPLPNLDYKIMQGNSLLESFEDIDLSKIHQRQLQVFEPDRDLFGNLTKPQMTIFQGKSSVDIQALISQYFNVEDSEKKSRLREQINKAVHDHIEYNIELRETQLTRRLAEAGKPENLNRKARSQYDKLLGEQKQLVHSRQNLHVLQDRIERPFFLWHLYFNDIFEASGGFDIVIGNPPYVQLQKMEKEANKLQSAGYQTFARTGDIYCLFYEKGNQLLKDGGILCYITSNKWMRAAYGEALRGYFSTNINPLIIIDFAGFKVFESATVDTNIFISQKSAFRNDVRTCVLGKGFLLTNMSDYFRQHSNRSCFPSNSSWVVLSSIEQNISAKIKDIGTPLKDWDVSIYRGILTGFNEAFIIDSATRDELIMESPNSAEIIRPILRGRDIKKYNITFSQQWLLNTHNGHRERGTSPVDVEADYPVIFQHLKIYEQLLKKRTDRGIHWSNLRNCAYIQDFEKQKIVWLELTDKPNFALDNDGYFINNTIYFMTGEKLKYILAFLNSRLCEWYFDKIAATSGVGTRRWIKMYIDQICIPFPTKEVEMEISLLVDEISTKSNPESQYQLINKKIYQLFALTGDEIDFIENSDL
jgi:type I restriction-modification system DNA methylase subunit